MFLLVGKVIRARPRTALLVLAVCVLVGVGLGLYGYALHRWHGVRSAVEQGRAAEAQAGLDFCLTVWPRSPAVHLLAARVARLTGDLSGAEAHLKYCIKLQHGATEATQLEFLLMRVQTGEEDEVAPDLFRLVDAGHPQTPLMLDTIAQAYMRRLRYGPAYNCLSRWIKEEPDAAKPHRYRAWVLEKLDNPREAMKDYQKALELDPDLTALRLRVAEMYLEDNQPQKAEAHLERLRQTAPEAEMPTVLARLGQCRLLQGRSPEARRLLEDAVRVLPRDLGVLLHLGKLEIEAEQPVKAEAWLRRALKEDQMDSEVQFNLSTCLAQQGRKAEADAMMQQYEHDKAELKRANQMLKDEARAGGKDPTGPAEVGALLLRIGHEGNGVYWLEQALLRDPNYQPAHRALADFFEKKGDTARAAYHRNKRTEPARKVSGP